jgi:beta-N-acetylhexosaminidase
MYSVFLPAISVLIVSFQIMGNNTHIKYLNGKTEKISFNTSEFINLSDSQKQLVNNKINSMTLREKIAQMVISSSFGENYDEDSPEYKKLKKLCQQTKVGGFIFFKGTASGYAGLSNKLQRLSETPLLISSDFERGTGMRLTDGSIFPNNMALGASGNSELAYKMGFAVAIEARSIGVHQNYAPVCDVNNNPLNPIINVRSFGEDPELVSKMSAAMIKGLQEGKVIATAKHFPGHGDTEIDSHSDLPVLNFSMDRLNNIELVPFKNAIDNNVKSVMIAHLSFPVLEDKPNVPSSLSDNIVNGLLINQLGFNGLVVTDALNMKGITNYFSTSEVAVMCVNAGIDLILMPLNEEETISAIENAVINGSITEERINISVEKILKAKEWLGLFEKRLVKEDDVNKRVNTSETKSIAQQIADESITLVKDEKNILPLKPDSENTLVISLSDEKNNTGSPYFPDLISDMSSDMKTLSADVNMTSQEVTGFVVEALSYDVLIVAVYAKVRYGTGKISIPAAQSQLIKNLDKLKKKLVVISFGNPYMLNEFPGVSTYICAYGDAEVSLKAAVKAIYGEIKFKGKLPVSINEYSKNGTGITK